MIGTLKWNGKTLINYLLNKDGLELKPESRMLLDPAWLAAFLILILRPNKIKNILLFYFVVNLWISDGQKANNWFSGRFVRIKGIFEIKFFYTKSINKR